MRYAFSGLGVTLETLTPPVPDAATPCFWEG